MARPTSHADHARLTSAFAGGFVDFHVCHRSVEDERADLRKWEADDAGAFGVDRFLVEDPAMAADDRSAGSPMCPARDRGEADVAMRNALHGDEAAGNQFQVGGSAFKDLGCVILDLALHFGGGADNRGSSHVGYAAGRGAPVVRRTVGVRTSNAHPVKRY